MLLTITLPLKYFFVFTFFSTIYANLMTFTKFTKKIRSKITKYAKICDKLQKNMAKYDLTVFKRPQAGTSYEKATHLQ